MNRSKSDKKRYTRSKSDDIVHISEPYNFKHSLHIGEKTFAGTEQFQLPGSPSVPCFGYSEHGVDGMLSNINISQLQLLKEKILPALRSEIVKISDEILLTIGNRLCNRCLHTLLQDDHGQNMNPDSDANSTDTVFLNETETEHRHASIHVASETEVKSREADNRSLDSFCYPVNIKTEQRMSIYSHQNRKKDKHKSDIHNQYGVQPKWADTPIKLRRSLLKPDERECMANALQWHIEELVDGIVFKDSELPDDLLADSCLTEDECAIVRKKLDRKDQVRVLLGIIKGRDLDILKRFLKHIRSHNQNVAKTIKETFERNIEEGMVSSECALCKLISQVNLKYIADILWKNRLIHDGLFNLIVETDKPTGDQDCLWSRVIECLNKVCKRNLADVRCIIENALTKKNHYHHIAKGIEWIINTNGALVCCCLLRCNNVSTFSLSSVVSSMCPKSTESELFRDSQSEISRFSTTAENSSVEEIRRGNTPQPYKAKVRNERSTSEENTEYENVEETQIDPKSQTEQECTARTHFEKQNPHTWTTCDETVETVETAQIGLKSKSAIETAETNNLEKPNPQTGTTNKNNVENIQEMQNGLTLKSVEETKDTDHLEEQTSQNMQGLENTIENVQITQEGLTPKLIKETTETTHLAKRKPQSGTIREESVENIQDTPTDLISKTETENTETKFPLEEETASSTEYIGTVVEKWQEEQNDLTSRSGLESTETKYPAKQKQQTPTTHANNDVEDVHGIQNGRSHRTEFEYTETKYPTMQQQSPQAKHGETPIEHVHEALNAKPAKQNQPVPIEKRSVKQIVNMFEQITK